MDRYDQGPAAPSTTTYYLVVAADEESGDAGVVAAVADERQARDILDGLADSETDSLARDEIPDYFLDVATRVVANGETPLVERFG